MGTGSVCRRSGQLVKRRGKRAFVSRNGQRAFSVPIIQSGRLGVLGSRVARGPHIFERLRSRVGYRLCGGKLRVLWPLDSAVAGRRRYLGQGGAGLSYGPDDAEMDGMRPRGLYFGTTAGDYTPRLTRATAG